jgi:imidazolonepropionase-like amidohydrolase
MNSLRTTIRTGAALAALAAGTAAPLPAQDIVVRGATLLTVTNGAIENGTVVIRDGRIAALGPAAEVSVPSGIPVIDGTGKYVMPGIIDAHSHMAMDGGRNERIDVVTPEVRVRIRPDTMDIVTALAGGVTTVHVMHGSHNVIGGQNAVIKLRWGQPEEGMLFAGAPRLVKWAFGENPMRSNTAPPLPARYPQTRRGVEHTLREAFSQARDYRAEWEAYERRARRDRNAIPPRRDLRLEALADIMRGEILVHAHAYRADEMLMAMRVAEEFGFRVTAFQHALEAYKIANELAAHGAAASIFGDDWGGFGKVETMDATPYGAEILVSRGVSLSINSDSEERIRRLFQEAGMLTKYGLTEEQALATITIEAARQIGLGDRIGSLEPGKDGDLAIFNGHPFAPTSRVETTVIDGRVYFDRERAMTLEKLLGTPVYTGGHR